LHDYRQERPSLVRWAEAKGEDGIADYWREKNMVSMDGLATGMD
ncbi:MAG: pyridoxamine 5'-phosphate oxidase, partial [Alphaproteobacteria bacterium HGW-Alphaproteobacteria-12]